MTDTWDDDWEEPIYNDNFPGPAVGNVDEDDGDVVTCQGCGVYRDMSWLGKPHACYRNEAGELEEGGTFQ